MAFTLIDVDTSWQDLAIAQEIVTSYNLRCQIFGVSAFPAPSELSIDFSFISMLQERFETLASLGWMSPSGSLGDLEGEAAFPSVYTASQAMTAAGLSQPGFWRRIPEGGSQPATWTDYNATGWSYGRITDKDLAGPWLFQDLQKALSALTRARLNMYCGRIKYFAGEFYSAYPDLPPFSSPIPSEAVAWSTDITGVPASWYQVGKIRTVNGIESASCDMGCIEGRLDVPDASAACETGRIVLAIATNPDSNYASYSGKLAYNQIDASDITDILDQTKENLSSKSSTGGVTTYAAIIGEEFGNSQPLADLILPDSAVPPDTAIDIELHIDAPYICIDFVFE